MTIWHALLTPAEIDALCRDTLIEHLGIRFVEVGDDFLSARMPVGHHVSQPAGLLHGGASIALAESLASIGAQLCIDTSKKRCLGLEVNANHLRAVQAGDEVTATGRPLHRGRQTQVWEVRLHDAGDNLVCIARVTLMIVDVGGTSSR